MRTVADIERDVRGMRVAERELTRRIAKRSMLEFCAYTKPDWITAPHHILLTDAADRVISGEYKRLLISLPPRHTKSEIFSIRLAALYLGKYPDRQIIHASYAASLSNEFSRQVREIIRNDVRYKRMFPGTVLHPDRQRLDDWKTTAGGGFYSIGVGGGVTGHGADLFIIDDPLKEGDADSPAMLESVFTWYLTAARTRLSPIGQIVLPMTRWHPNDPIGRLLDLARSDENADQWVYVCLPGLIETREQAAADPLGRSIGDALWPERFSKGDLLAVKSLSPRWFAGLYQQDPQPEATKLFFEKDFWRFEKHHFLMDAPGVWCFDLATSDDEIADFTVIGRWRKFDEHLYVSHLRRVQYDWPKVIRLLKLLMRLFPDDLFAFPKQTLELLAVKQLRALGPEYARRLVDVSFPAKSDKRSRALTFADWVSQGRVSVQEGKHGDLFIREHDRFPDAHDDCVDMSSVATHHFGLHRVFDFLVAGKPEVRDGVAAS